MKKSMNQKRNTSSPSAKLSPASVNRSVTEVDPPPFDAFFKENLVKPKMKHEFTLKQFKESTGLGDSAAARSLNKEIEDGRVTFRFSNGKTGIRYYSLTK